MKKNDFLLILCVLVLAGGVFLWNNLVRGDAGGEAVVYVDGEVYASYPLNEERELVIETEYGKNFLIIKDGKADMTEADCPDGLCVKQHSIYKTGQTIVCLPHRVVVEVEGGQANELDGMTQ
ncbi:MAG: NusG domain II-containing protein [Lachnospiraceae bacterium]|nr:NusG domain II-containing protein [Lachnospiraceae bacterium]